MSIATINPTTLTGVQKVALALTQMDREQASNVMRHFSEMESDAIIPEIVRLNQVDRETVDSVLAEIHDVVQAGPPPGRGGKLFAAGLLADTFGSEQADSVMSRLASTMAGRSFDFLESVEPTQIAALLDDELPQTVALVLGHLKPETSSVVLSNTDPTRRIAIATSLATMGSAQPDAVRVVSDALRATVGNSTGRSEPASAVGGVQPLVDIINRTDVNVEREMLEELAKTDPLLAEEIQSLMLTFTDIVRFEPSDVHLILRGIDNRVLAMALKGAPDEVEQMIQRNISERAQERLYEELSSLGSVRRSQVDEARAEIVRQIRQLESEGRITIQRVEEEDVLVS